ncbi:MAG: immunoglobulin-like domain-containing protein, partial [Bacteroidota bacterium]
MKPKIFTNYLDTLLPSVLSRVMPLLAFFFMATVAMAQIDAAVLTSTQAVNMGDDVTVEVWIYPDGNEVQIAEIDLNFDPAVLQAKNPPYQPHPVLQPPAFPFPQPIFDNATGDVFYNGSTFGTGESNDFVLVTIYFTAIADGVADITWGSNNMFFGVSGSLGVNSLANAKVVVGNTAPSIASFGAVPSVDEQSTLSVPLSITDHDGDNLTVTYELNSTEPQLLQSANSGTQVDPFPTTAVGFFTEANVVSAAGSYTADLEFAPTFGDGGGANGDLNGTYSIVVTVEDEDGNMVQGSFPLTVNDIAQPIAGLGTSTIQAESFDNQGPPNGSPANTSDANGIGVEVNNPGVTNIGFTQVGDFAEYLIDVAAAGLYELKFQVAKNSGNAATMTISSSGSGGALGSISVSPTGGWQTYVPVTAQVSLPAGPQTLRFDWTAGNSFLFNIDYFEVTRLDGPPVVMVPEDLNLLMGDNAEAEITVSGGASTPNVTFELFDKSDPVGSTNNPINPSAVISPSDYTFGEDPQNPGTYLFKWITTTVPGRSYLARVTADDGSNDPVVELFSINIAQDIPGDILARTFSAPLPWYGGNPPSEDFVAIEQNAAQNIGWLYTEGFVDYEVNVAQAGVYQVTVFAGKGHNASFVTTVSEEDGNGGFTPLGSFDAVNSGWQQYQPYTFQATLSSPGPQTIRLSFSGSAGVNIRNFTFEPVNLIDPPSDLICADGSEVLYRINAGGPDVTPTAPGEAIWQADAGTGFLTAGGTNTFGTNHGADLSGVPADLVSGMGNVFQNERWDGPGGDEMKYVFPVESGQPLKVSLLLMEGFATESGVREFNVSVNGSVPTEFADIDPHEDAGGEGIAYIREYSFTPASNSLELEFLRTDKDNPAIRGIQVCGSPLTNVDTTPPVITLDGDNPLVLPIGGIFVDPGATAEDDVDGTLNPMDIVVDDSALDPSTPGEYDVIYTISDAAGNEGQATRVVSFTDQSPPSISLLGDNPLQLIVGDAYLEAGATAQDDQDGDISGDIVIDASGVNTAVAGAYVVTYNVSDAAGNAATEVTRNVNVSEVPAVADCGTVLFRVNAGGPATVAADATLPDFTSDTGPIGNAGNSPFLVANSVGTSTYSGTAASAHPGPIIATHPSLANVPYAALDVFNTERFDAPSDPEQSWSFPVTPGSDVQVTLLFAELFGQIDAPGERVFDVEIEGQILPGFNDIDQFAIAGAKGAFARSASLTVNDGSLDIQFLHVIENPAIKGIQVCDVSNQAPTITL